MNKRLVWSVLCCAGFVGHARAEELSALRCYRISPSQRVQVTADLIPSEPMFPAQPFCRIRGPYAACGPVAAQNVAPSPSGTAAGDAGGYQLCYKLTCNDPVPSAQLLADAFGTFRVVFGRATLFCTPAVRVGSVTTTTTSTTTSTTFAGSSAAAFVAP